MSSRSTITNHLAASSFTTSTYGQLVSVTRKERTRCVACDTEECSVDPLVSVVM